MPPALWGGAFAQSRAGTSVRRSRPVVPTGGPSAAPSHTGPCPFRSAGPPHRADPGPRPAPASQGLAAGRGGRPGSGTGGGQSGRGGGEARTGRTPGAGKGRRGAEAGAPIRGRRSRPRGGGLFPVRQPPNLRGPGPGVQSSTPSARAGYDAAVGVSLHRSVQILMRSGSRQRRARRDKAETGHGSFPTGGLRRPFRSERLPFPCTCRSWGRRGGEVWAHGTGGTRSAGPPLKSRAPGGYSSAIGSVS
jgi:hypothetical protein